MDYEKRLALAKEALESGSYDKETIEYIFPELAESEDERIRKEILEYIDKATGCKEWIAWLEKQKKETSQVITDSEDERIRKNIKIALMSMEDNLSVFYSTHHTSQKELLDWLEKQGKKSIVIDVDKMVMEYAQTKDGDFGLPVNCMIRAYRKGINDTLRLSLNLEKQGEQKQDPCEDCNHAMLNCGNFPCEEKKGYNGEEKSTDKVEPKFRVGDWIVEPRDEEPNGLWHIDRIEDGSYWYDKCGCTIKYADKNFHLWTIQDAKDGDVLANKNGAVFINADSSKERATLDCYCYLSVQNEFCVEEHKTGSWLYKDDIKPATEEQRNLFFQKMKEAGYEWNADKKELKKIEQKFVWSEEDEEMKRAIVGSVSVLKNMFHKEEMQTDYNRMIEWIKSLKNKIHWKPTEEQMNLLIGLSYNPCLYSYERRSLEELYNELKNL